MSKVIALSPDLNRLSLEGYSLELKDNVVLVREVPYITPARTVELGVLATPLVRLGDRAGQPSDHTVWFIGLMPQLFRGGDITALQHPNGPTVLDGWLSVDRMFSCKPSGLGNFPDYYSKMKSYIDIISSEAMALDPHTTPTPFSMALEAIPESVHNYTDTASIRSAILPVSRKLDGQRIAIFGTGGSGGYILDFVAKTPAAEVHLYDKDVFHQHNAFRAPGAATIEEIRARLAKVDYFAAKYAPMHRQVVPHLVSIDESNVDLIPPIDFAFVAVDHGPTRKVLANYLVSRRIPFIDSAIGIQLSPNDTLFGTCTTTFVAPGDVDALRHLYFADDTAEDLYKTPVQVAELNCLVACHAVIRWKKFLAFYEDKPQEVVSDYSIAQQVIYRTEA